MFSNAQRQWTRININYAYIRSEDASRKYIHRQKHSNSMRWSTIYTYIYESGCLDVEVYI